MLIPYNKVHLIFFKRILNTKCRGGWQSLLPLPDLSGKIEGDSAGRVQLVNQPKELQGSLKKLRLERVDVKTKNSPFYSYVLSCLAFK